MKQLTIILLFCALGFSQELKVEERKVDIIWSNNLDSAFAVASVNNKIIMIDFMAEWCPPCKRMSKEVFPNTKIINRTENFIPIKIDIEKQKDIAEKYNANARKYGGIGIPNILFINKNQDIIHHIVGFHNVDRLMGIMDSISMNLYKKK